ncbi:MAG TPA: hypothetical protein PKY82_02045 [Pyrinomonadaceae bacterium]|nr:hypothetical protein [Pyrinomonadaceae bacterium]
MPKTSYNTKEEIPADQVGCYTERNGKWVLTDLENDHPVIITKTELETTQTGLKTTISDLQTRVAVAESKTLQDGMVPVSPIVKKLGEAAQTAGLTDKEIPTLKTRADQAEAKLKEREESELISTIADETGKNRIAFAEHVKANGLKFETKTEKVDDKDVTTRLVVTTDADGKEVKTSITEYLKTRGTHIAAAKAKADGDDDTIDVIDQDPADKTRNTGNEFDAIRQEVDTRYGTANTENVSFADKFHGRNLGAK